MITAAGDDPDVSALVYVAALQPDVGESLGEVTALAPSVLPDDALVASEDGFLIIDPDRFPAIFGADLPADVTMFMAHAQAPTAAASFGTEMKTAARRNKPVFALSQPKIKPSIQTSSA